jgi:hypothetical protein
MISTKQMNYHINLNGETKGPYTLEELKQMVAEATLGPSTYAILEGSEKWITAGEILGLFEKTATGQGFPPLPTGGEHTRISHSPPISADDVAKHVRHGAQKAFEYGVNLTSQSTGFWGAVIRTSRAVLSESRMRSALDVLSRFGVYAMAVAAIGVLVSSVFLSFKSNSSSDFGFPPIYLLGIGIFVIGAISLVQYLASRFMNTGETVIQATPTRLGSEALTEAVALLNIVLSSLFAALDVILVLKTDEASLLVSGAATFFSGALSAGIALNPGMLNMALNKDCSAGESALGVISFSFKSALMSVPAVFGVMSLSGTLLVLWGTMKVMVGEATSGLFPLGMGVGMVILAGLIPIFGLLIFLFAHLGVDLCSSVLRTPLAPRHPPMP